MRLFIALDIEDDTIVNVPHDDPQRIAEWITGAGDDVPFVVRNIVGSFNAPAKFVRPLDHEERVATMENVAQWRLGDPSWASTLFTAYEFPDEAVKVLIAEGWEED